MYKTAIITLSDSSYAGTRQDLSAPAIIKMLPSSLYSICSTEILPDDYDALVTTLTALCDAVNAPSLILTTGGTGFSPRDITPEATAAVCERLAPGIAEAMRYASLQITPRAMLSRGIAGIRKKTLIINLPGSPKAVKENLQAILPALDHGLAMLLSNGSANCAES